MLGPYQVLGISPAASPEEIRHAYRELARRWHPDQFTDEAQKAEAQEKLIAINSAYEQAMKLANAGHWQSPYSLEMDPNDAKAAARRMLRRGAYAGALRDLLRCTSRDADWYALQGEILSAMDQYESAMQSWREAVRREPDNNEYRRCALEAELAWKKSKTLGGRLKSVFRKKK